MSFAAGHASVQARFHYQRFFGCWWQVDDVAVGPFACAVLPGGLVVGNVSDANTGLGLNGATVTALADGGSATTAAAPGQGDGFYSLFAAGSGSQDFEAAAHLHTSLTKNATVAADAVVRLDFSLPAGLLDAGPRPLSAVVSPGGGTQSLTLDVVEHRHGRRELRPPRGGRAAARRSRRSRPALVLSPEERKAVAPGCSPLEPDRRASRRGPACRRPSSTCRRPPGAATS